MDKEPTLYPDYDKHSEICVRCGKPVKDHNREYCKACREEACGKNTARDKRRKERDVRFQRFMSAPSIKPLIPKESTFKPSTQTTDGVKGFNEAMKDPSIRANVDRLLQQAESNKQVYHRDPIIEDEDFTAYLPRSSAEADKMLSVPAKVKRVQKNLPPADPVWYSHSHDEYGNEVLVENRGQRPSWLN